LARKRSIGARDRAERPALRLAVEAIHAGTDLAA
jgi:hypothetical protein